MSRHQKSSSQSIQVQDSHSSRTRPGKESPPHPGVRGEKTCQHPAYSGSRRDELERARLLLKDSNYPSDEVIHSVAKLLARNWRRLSKVS